jgi:hypothetical protein
MEIFYYHYTIIEIKIKINDLIGNKLFYNCKNEIIENVIDLLNYYFNKYKKYILCIYKNNYNI